MWSLMDRTGLGKFRFESSKTKGGRIYIPSGITKSPNFPFKNGNTVKITLTKEGYLILENYRNMRIEPINPECETCSFSDWASRAKVKISPC
jgi:hypothetical protein